MKKSVNALSNIKFFRGTNMTLPFWAVITYLFLMFVLAGVVMYMVFKMQLMGEVIEEQQSDIMKSSCVMETIREKINVAVKVLGPLT